MNLRELVVDLEARREKIRQMGGPERVERQHERGKLTARERLALLFDDGIFFEVGMHGRQMGPAGEKGDTPADGVVCGFGKVEGRMVCAAAYDFTVKGGSIGQTGEEKVTRLRKMALQGRWPIVWLIDSAGARIDPGQRSSPRRAQPVRGLGSPVPRAGGDERRRAAGGRHGGAWGGGHRVHPGPRRLRAHGQGRRLAGARADRPGQGRDRPGHRRAGARWVEGAHNEVSGVGDAEVKNDHECIALTRKYLSFMPSSCDEAPPRLAVTDPVDRREESLLDLLPETRARPTTCTR